MNQIEEIMGNLVKAIDLAGDKIELNQIEIVDAGCPHKIQSLPSGKMAIYTFFHKGKCLKIGKVGSKSNARYTSQHYNPDSSNSNLSKKLLSDNNFRENNSFDNIGDWIKENTQRINIIIPENINVFVLNFMEAFLQLKLKPKYEG